MPPSVAKLQVSKDRRDHLLLIMAMDAARVKQKAREVRRKNVRQIGYRSVRYQRFQGRRDEVLEEETQERRRIRRVKSIQAMQTWLVEQAQANAEEGTPREVLAKESSAPGVGV